MKYLLLTVLIVVTGCVAQTTPRNITKSELNQIFIDDNVQNKSIVWIYNGSDNIYHYFTRTVASALTFDKNNGMFVMDKFQLNLGKKEFMKSSDGSTPKETSQIFTKVAKDGKNEYSIKYIE